MPVAQSTCPVCSSERRSRLPVANLWHKIMWWHVRCTDCSHRYVELFPTDAELALMYDRSYFSDGGGWVCGFWQGSYESNERHLREEAVEALKAISVKRGRLLEIGCAGGFFLDEARAAGFDVTGVELNPEMVEHARTKLSLIVHQGMFEHVGLDPNSFDVIVAQDVLEHVRDPRAFVSTVATLLAQGGYFFVRGPLEDTTKGWVYRTVRTFARRGEIILREPPFHLQGFCQRSFVAVVHAGGLAPERFQAGATAPRWDFAGVKNALVTVMERLAFYVDRVRGGGDFMTALARKDAPLVPRNEEWRTRRASLP